MDQIGNGTVALLGDPDSWDRLRQDPALVSHGD